MLTVSARKPFALAILALSIAIAAAVALHDQWSERAWWVLAWGCLMYTIAVVLAPLKRPPARPEPATPDRPNGFSTQPTEQFVHLTEEALRCLNNPAALARCDLSIHIPASLVSVLKRRPEDRQPTPLELAPAVREILTQAMERLRPAGNENRRDSQASLLHQVVHDEHVLGRPNASIMIRLSISERTFYRYRREGVNAIARELWVQERRLGGE